MDEDDAARLADIGRYVVVTDVSGHLIVRWDGLAALTSPLGTFGLEFDVSSIGLAGHCRPFGTMFDLWEIWKPRHPELADELAVAIELEMEAAGVTGEPTDQIATARVVISQIEDGPNCVYFTMGAKLELRFGPTVACELNTKTARLKFS